MMNAPSQHRTRQWIVATGVFFFSAVVVFALIWRWEQQTLVEVRARAADLATDHAQTLQRDIERALSATYAIAALIRQGQGNVADFEAVATEMLPFYPGIAALGLAPDGIIRNVAPLAGNENSIGFDPLKDNAQNQEAIKARDTGRLTLAGPLKLAQGGLGIVGRLPVFLNNAQGHKVFWGFTYVTLRFPDALASARLPLLTQRGYAYELWRTAPDTGERQSIEASGNTVLDAPVERTLELPNGQWTLSVAPINGWGQSDRIGFEAAAGLFLSLLIAYLAWLLYEMRVRDQGLEVQVNERTAEILATQRQLQATLGAIPDPLLELGLDGRCYNAHSSRTDSLPWPTEDLIGRTVMELLPPEACQVVLAALQEAKERECSIGKQIKVPLDNGMHWFELSVTRKSAVSGEEPLFLVLCRDITESKQAERKIRLLAHFDSLTGLPNRELLTDRCNLALSAAQRNDTPLALLLLDLDHFKNVNDSLGHRVGDELLTALAGRLKSAVREQDTVSRLGGDEFILILPETDGVGAAHVAEKLLKSALVAFEIEPHELTVTPSIGIALFPDDGSDFDSLSRCADAAMYRAKQDGRNNYRFFTAEMQARSERTLTLENALRRALERNQLRLHYQPQVRWRVAASLAQKPCCDGIIPNWVGCRRLNSFPWPRPAG
jgi:diguanylate cyclase (GGDEF)-like protein/PAS domain S-box-containing protein